jgi:hypothetical protein
MDRTDPGSRQTARQAAIAAGAEHHELSLMSRRKLVVVPYFW